MSSLTEEQTTVLPPSSAPDVVSPPSPVWWRDCYPLWIALALYALVLVCTTSAAMHRTDGRLIYVLDDTYIHLAIVKNLLHHGVWGVSPYEFTAASSSPLWVLLLAIPSLLFGPREVLPYLLNLLMGAALLTTAFFLLRRRQLPGWLQTAVLLLLVVVTPLAPLVMCGMEHLLHATLVLLFVACLLPALAPDARPERARAVGWMLALTPLLVLARFESLFLLGIASMLFLLRRRWRAGVALLLLAFAPLLVTGLIQLAHGGFWFPNSVVAKSPLLNEPSGSVVDVLLSAGLLHLRKCPALALLLFTAVITFIAQWIRQRGVRTPGQGVLLCFIGATLAQVTLATVGMFYRYEAYLIVLGIVVLALEMSSLLDGRRRARPFPGYAVFAVLLWVMSFASLYLLGCRAYMAQLVTPRAARHIYLQQYQMGHFIRACYPHSGVFANDIGAICYFSDTRLVDCWGLGTTPICAAMLRHAPLAPVIDSLTQLRGVHIAIFYEEMLGYNRPAGWTRVGILYMDKRDAYWNSRFVSIFAPAPADVLPAVAQMYAFKSRLPAGTQFAFDTNLLNVRISPYAVAVRQYMLQQHAKR